MTTRDYGIVDAWAMPSYPPIAQRWNSDPKRAHGLALFGESGFGGMSIDEQVAEMDEWGVEIAILSAIVESDDVKISNEEVADCIAKYPDRFRGAIAVDPRKPMKALKEIEHWVADGFVNLKICSYGYGFDNPPNSKLWYPLYAKACELDISVTIQVGHTGPLLPSEGGRPIYLDEVALTFPELVIIGAHIGWPWEEEMGMLAWKHPNVYIDTSAYAPSRYPERFVKFLKRRAPHKVLWATDYPAIRYDRGISEIAALDLGPEVERLFLSDNARKIFKLPPSRTQSSK
jgi:uncharacterized protein